MFCGRDALNINTVEGWVTRVSSRLFSKLCRFIQSIFVARVVIEGSFCSAVATLNIIMKLNLANWNKKTQEL